MTRVCQEQDSKAYNCSLVLLACGCWWLLDEAVAIWEGLYIAEDISLHPVIYDIMT